MKVLRWRWLLVNLLISHAVCAQFYFAANGKTEPELLWEAGLSPGIFNCLTDLGGSKGAGKKFVSDINWNQTRPCLGAFVSASWHYQFGIRLQAIAGSVTGSDAVLKTARDEARNRYLRNLRVKTSVLEVSVLTEWFPLMLIDGSREVPLFSPYLLGGAGIFHYNPTTEIDNHRVNLRQLHTEGQGFAEYPDRRIYSSYSWCLPLGAGVKYDAGRAVNIRLDLTYRITGTDYLDDVSTRYIDPTIFSRHLSAADALLAIRLADRSNELTPGSANHLSAIRGNPANRDAYFSCNLTASVALGRWLAK